MKVSLTERTDTWMQIQGACTLMMRYGNGRLSELKGMEVQHIELFSEYEDVSSFKLRELSAFMMGKRVLHSRIQSVRRTGKEQQWRIR